VKTCTFSFESDFAFLLDDFKQRGLVSKKNYPWSHADHGRSVKTLVLCSPEPNGTKHESFWPQIIHIVKPIDRRIVRDRERNLGFPIFTGAPGAGIGEIVFAWNKLKSSGISRDQRFQDYFLLFNTFIENVHARDRSQFHWNQSPIYIVCEFSIDLHADQKKINHDPNHLLDFFHCDIGPHLSHRQVPVLSTMIVRNQIAHVRQFSNPSDWTGIDPFVSQAFEVLLQCLLWMAEMTSPG